MDKRGRKKTIGIIFFLIVIVLAVAIYFTFFFYYKCDNISCFKAHQQNCDKTKFNNDLEDATWQYKIKGKKAGQCVIYVKFLQVKKGEIDLQKLEGKDMVCFLPLGSSDAPESDLSKCHGILKEEMQNLIIQKLHSYITSNLGQISSELEQVI